MSEFSSYQVPAPKTWQEFETLCWDLWKEIWQDPNAQKNGRQGQVQNGVDLWGNPNQEEAYAGVQCKGKDSYTNGILTEEEIRDEVKKAKNFQPQISQYIIVTTGPKDAKVEELARKISVEHLKLGLFSVTAMGWVDVVDRLSSFPHLIEKYYPGLGPVTAAIKEDIDEIKQSTQALLESRPEKNPLLSAIMEQLNPLIAHSSDITAAVLTTEHQAELDLSRELINSYKPKTALVLLEDLRKRVWSTAQPIVRFRILTNIGTSKLSLNQEIEAAKLFIEALQYNSEDEKAILNAALGHLLLRQKVEAKTFADEVLKKNSASIRAYSIIIDTFENEDFDEIVRRIPEPYRKSLEVAHALGSIARKKRNYPEAVKWFETAIECDEKKSPDPKAGLAETIIESVLENRDLLATHQISHDRRNQITRAVDLLSDAWKDVENTEIREIKTGWLAQRGMARKLIGNMEEAVQDLDQAMSLQPLNPLFTRQRGIWAYETGDYSKAIQLLKQSLDLQKAPETSFLLAVVFRVNKQFDDAVKVLTEVIADNPESALLEETQRTLIQTFTEKGDLESAKKISESMRAEEPTNILNLVDGAIILSCGGNNAEALSLLREAQKYVTDETPMRHIHALAREFYTHQIFEDASILFEKITDTKIDSPLTYQLLNSYYRAGKIGPALELNKALLTKYGPSRNLSGMLSALYEEIQDLPKAKAVCEEYLEKFPDDSEMRLRKAVIDFRSNDMGELDEYLEKYHDLSSFSIEACIQLAQLYLVRNRDHKALEIMYETRRRFYDNSEAHLRYVGLFLQRDKDADEWLNIVKVGLDTAVCVEESSGNREWYIIESRDDADIRRREFKSDHQLAKRLMGKSIGEEILFSESHFSKEIGKIIEIKSKYVYALHESMNDYEKLFPDASGLFGLRLDLSDRDGGIPAGLQIILDEATRIRESQSKVEELYKKGQLTVGAFAKFIGRDVLKVWGGLIQRSDLGLRCARGTLEERVQAEKLFEEKPKLIVDVISLMTIHGLKAHDIVTLAFGKLGIAQSTLELIQNRLYELRGIESKGYMQIGKEGDTNVREVISEDEVKTQIEKFEAILTWISENCDVLPVTSALEMNRAHREHLEELIGESFVDTILIANQEGHILFSDDERLRSLAKTDFNVDGVWTQSVLGYCLRHNYLEKKTFDEMTVKLASSHYYHTSIDAHALIEAARQAEWSPSSPFTTLIQHLTGKYSDLSAINVGTDFLYELWKQPIIEQRRDFLILTLIDALTDGRNRAQVLQRLAILVGQKFHLLPLAARQVFLMIEVWRQMHVS